MRFYQGHFLTFLSRNYAHLTWNERNIGKNECVRAFAIAYTRLTYRNLLAYKLFRTTEETKKG